MKLSRPHHCFFWWFGFSVTIYLFYQFTLKLSVASWRQLLAYQVMLSYAAQFQRAAKRRSYPSTAQSFTPESKDYCHNNLTSALEIIFELKSVK
jgi:hypothetical protein